MLKLATSAPCDIFTLIDDIFEKNFYTDRTGFPRANVSNISTKNDLKIKIELGLLGWNKNNSKIDISIYNDILTVEGEKNKDSDIPKDADSNYGKYYLHNLSTKAKFIWKYTVPKNTILKEAFLEDGILQIILNIPTDKLPPKQQISL